MPTLGNTPRPAYVYDTETDTWVPVGVGAHTHDTLYVNQNVIDAKGDLLVGTADNAYSRLGKGADGTVLVADNSTSTGLAWQPYGAIQVAGKNVCINGNFDIWQRGTTFANPINTYSADRWYIDGGTNVSVSRQSVGAPLGSRYYMQIAMTNSAYGNPQQFLETSTVSSLWGRTATFSVLLRRNSTFANNLVVVAYKSSTVDAGPSATWIDMGGSAFVSNSQLPTGTSSSDWYKATVTFTVPNDGTANSIKVLVGQTAIEANTAYYQISQAQLELGSAPTPFSRAGGTIQGELAACQRYYWRNVVWGVGIRYVGNIYVPVMHRTEMRTSPAVSRYANGDALGIQAISSITVSDSSPYGFSYNFASSGTDYQATRCFVFLEASAEL
jgi:hypothetical protein